MGQNPSRRYAQAFFDYAQEHDQLDALYGDFEQLSKLARELPLLSALFRNPIISAEQRKDILEKTFKGRLHPTTMRCMHFLEKKRRIQIFEDVAQAFCDLCLRGKNILHVKVISSVELLQDQIEHLKEKLKAKFHKDVAAELHVDPKLIGGIQVQIADTKYDFSIQAQLERLRRKMI